ncbi:hypothetical protein G6F38_012573 [Rhizopus arrhizus]|nr:hypothetical protein G6F38_012573 [Rhizopus arrhizus]
MWTVNLSQIPVTEKECMAVQWGLLYFHCYVHDALSLTVYTDHVALKSILATKDPKGRIARMIVDIWSYEFTVCYRKGIDNSDADAMSRIQVPEKVIQINSQENKFTSLKEMKDAQLEEPYLKEMIEGTVKVTFPFALKGGLVCFIKYDPPVLVIPKKMQEKFLTAIHEHITSGHTGRDKTLEKAKANGYWKTINEDVKTFVKKCTKCQMYKTPTHKYKKMTSIEIGLPTEVWAADIAYLPESTKGNKYLLVFMDYMTKCVWNTEEIHRRQWSKLCIRSNDGSMQ